MERPPIEGILNGIYTNEDVRNLALWAKEVEAENARLKIVWKRYLWLSHQRGTEEVKDA